MEDATGLLIGIVLLAFGAYSVCTIYLFGRDFYYFLLIRKACSFRGHQEMKYLSQDKVWQEEALLGLHAQCVHLGMRARHLALRCEGYAPGRKLKFLLECDRVLNRFHDACIDETNHASYERKLILAAQGAKRIVMAEDNSKLYGALHAWGKDVVEWIVLMKQLTPFLKKKITARMRAEKEAISTRETV
ncbi:MAG TPA: hypothetical protein VD928_01900 [Candidatus Paceibacterota bacterium]|nr:hypothetical protein [Candidatus Paceibacterota bacterium]